MHLVMFDVDGTLTASHQYDSECYIAAIKDVLQIEKVDMNWISYLHATDTYIAIEIFNSALGRAPSEQELNRVLDRFMFHLQRTHAERSELYREIPGAKGLLRFLQASSQYAISIATGGWNAPARYKLVCSGFEIDEIPMASASDSYVREEIMKVAADRALSHYGVGQFDSVTYVGDAVWDTRASANLGYDFIGVGSNLESLQKAGAVHLVKDYADPSVFVELLQHVTGQQAGNLGVTRPDSHVGDRC
jgi:phosphoglycolate phosphatase-like HAD superfamily hydrolase|tara:strand:+ start:3283 stop:4026 length:744 start_codon:yes stop_codon:yes gene_type:complete